MPSDCTFRFCGVYRQHYIIVGAECLGVFEHRFFFKCADAGKQYANCRYGDGLVFQGKFRIVPNRNLESGVAGWRVVEGVDNNSAAIPAKRSITNEGMHD